MNHVENRNLSGGTLNIPDWNLGPSTGYVWAISQCHVSVTIFRMGTSVRGGSVLARFSVWAFQSARSRSEMIFPKTARRRLKCPYCTILVEKLVPSSPFQTTSRTLSADDVFFLTISGVILLHERRHHGIGNTFSHYRDVICDGPAPPLSYSARGPFASKYRPIFFFAVSCPRVCATMASLYGRKRHG